MAPKTKVVSKENCLTSQELDAIIRLCSQLGVAELTFGSLHIKFGVKSQTESKAPLQATTDVEISEIQHKEQTRQAIAQDEVRTKEERLAFAIIEEPTLAEEMLEDGDFLNDDELDNGSDRESDGVGSRPA
jgi:hypothetical protein